MKKDNKQRNRNINLTILLLMIFCLTNVNSLAIDITYPTNEQYIIQKDIDLIYTLSDANGSINCSVTRNAVLLYGKSYLTEGQNMFFITQNNLTEGYLKLTVSCADDSDVASEYIYINKATLNNEITITDIFYFITFISIFISILLFAPFGFLKPLNIENPIHYGMIAVTLSVLIALGLNQFNFFFNLQPLLYYIGIMINIGNILLSIPNYIHNSLQTLQNKKVFGSEKDYRMKR